MEPIELTLMDGSPVTINGLAMAYFQPADDNTLIMFTGGSSIVVREAYDVLAEMFNPERQAAEPC